MSRSRIAPQVVLLGLASLLNDISSDIIYPLLPIFLTSSLGATPMIIGLIEGTAEALSSLLKYWAGRISDRLPRRKPFIVSGYLLAAVARGLIALAVRWPMVLTARLLDKTGKGIRSAPRDALIAEVTSPDSRGRAFGFHRALDHLGAVIGPLLGALMLGVFLLPLRTIFLLAVLPGLAGVLMLVIGLRETPRPPAPAPKGSAAAESLPRPFWKAMFAIGLFYLANSSDAFLILYAHGAGVPLHLIPLLWAAHHAVKSLGATAAGSLSDRAGRPFLLIAGWTVYAGVYVLFPHARSLPFFLALFIVYAVPFALTEGAERAWIADLVPEGARGRSFGIYYMAVGLCSLAGTIGFGFLYQRYSPLLAFRAAAGIALLAACAVYGGYKGARSET